MLLICDECGCASDEDAHSWTAFTVGDTEGHEATGVVIMCPVCAYREFKRRPGIAERYT